MASNGIPQSPSIAILMVSFPMQGHLNQLLHFSRLIAPHGIHIHFASTATHNRQTQQRVQGWDPLSDTNIIFHQLPSLHYFQCPNSKHTSSSTEFPSHLQPMFDASIALRHPIRDLTRQLCQANRRVVVIYDSLMGTVVQDLVDFPNAEAYMFHSVSAYTMFFFLWENLGKPFEVNPQVLEGVPPLAGCFTPEFTEFIRSQHRHRSFYSGRIYNTSKVLEQEFLDLLARHEINGDKKQWALGPFNPVHPLPSTRDGKSHHHCLEWLDKQPPNSVIFVSFGTSTTIPKKQIQELAMGLEKSQQKFIWVARGADTCQGEIGKMELPLGFEDRVKERAIIIRDWAPQLSILGHSSTGGFMSHCGWNSSMEGISMGVPIAAWPMHSDQPRNSVLISKVLKIGVVVRDWGRRGEAVTAAEVESVVRWLMVTEEGKEMRKRAAMVGATVREAMGKGKLTQLELESFISHICR